MYTFTTATRVFTCIRPEPPAGPSPAFSAHLTPNITAETLTLPLKISLIPFISFRYIIAIGDAAVLDVSPLLLQWTASHVTENRCSLAFMGKMMASALVLLKGDGLQQQQQQQQQRLQLSQAQLSSSLEQHTPTTLKALAAHPAFVAEASLKRLQVWLGWRSL